MAECLLSNVKDNYNGMCVKIINFFISKGLTPSQALGICANVFQESGYDPANENKISKAYGLFQWHPGASVLRRQKFEKWCDENGYGNKKANADVQLEYVWVENYNNYRNYYLSHKGISAHESLIWWQNNVEVCDAHPNDGVDDCLTKKRETELERLKKLYNDNVKTNDCAVNTVNGDSDDDPCDDEERTVFYEEASNNGENGNKSGGFNLKEPFLPLGSGNENTKPVIFGSSWAFKASPYMFNRGYLSYASWKQRPFKFVKRAKKLNKGYYGLKENYLNHDDVITTADYIKKYFQKSENKPKHIIVLCGLNDDVTLTTDYNKNVSKLLSEYIAIFNAAGKTTVYAASYGESYNDNERYKVFNEAIKRASLNFKNVKYIDMSGVCTAIMKEYHKDGKNKPGNGIFCEDGWKVYANQLMTYVGSN